MPGAIPEKFEFTVLNDEVAKEINRHMGRRVSMHYEQKVGLPTSCFGETRYYVTRVSSVDDGMNPQGIPGQPGMTQQPAQPAPAPAQLPAPGSQPMTAPTSPGLPSVPVPVPQPVQPVPVQPAPMPAPVQPVPVQPVAPAAPGVAPAR
jgi:hypothetical protein